MFTQTFNVFINSLNYLLNNNTITKNVVIFHFHIYIYIYQIFKRIIFCIFNFTSYEYPCNSRTDLNLTVGCKLHVFNSLKTISSLESYVWDSDWLCWTFLIDKKETTQKSCSIDSCIYTVNGILFWFMKRELAHKINLIYIQATLFTLYFLHCTFRSGIATLKWEPLMEPTIKISFSVTSHIN